MSPTGAAGGTSAASSNGSADGRAGTVCDEDGVQFGDRRDERPGLRDGRREDPELEDGRDELARAARAAPQRRQLVAARIGDRTERGGVVRLGGREAADVG